LLHRGRHPTEIAATLSLSLQTIFNIKRRYLTTGLDSALHERPRSGKPPKIDGTARAKITALACSTAPKAMPVGRCGCWPTKRLNSASVSISHETVGVVLKNSLQPHRQRSWCIGQITGEYLARMEDLLHLYSLPYNEHLPIVCFDELPVQLLGEVVTPLPMKAGQPKRLDYEYARQGVARCSWPLSL
jgi:transposase